MKVFRQRWVPVLIIGLVLFIVSIVLLNSGVNILFPPTIILGAFLVPVTFTTYIGGFERGLDIGKHRIIPPGIVVWFFIIGGAIGVTFAALIEFATLRTLGIPQLFGVGFIEESAKLILPIIIFLRSGYKTEADGLLFGIASGMGFAALETIGYGFTAFVQSNGNPGAVESLLIVRGLLSPAGHAAWTGLVCATLWHEREKAGHGIVNFIVIGTYILAIVLHALWDIVGSSNLPGAASIAGYIVLGGTSITLLVYRIRQASKRPMVT